MDPADPLNLFNAANLAPAFISLCCKVYIRKWRYKQLYVITNQGDCFMSFAHKFVDNGVKSSESTYVDNDLWHFKIIQQICKCIQLPFSRLIRFGACRDTSSRPNDAVSSTSIHSRWVRTSAGSCEGKIQIKLTKALVP